MAHENMGSLFSLFTNVNKVEIGFIKRLTVINITELGGFFEIAHSN